MRKIIIRLSEGEYCEIRRRVEQEDIGIHSSMLSSIIKNVTVKPETQAYQTAQYWSINKKLHFSNSIYGDIIEGFSDEVSFQDLFEQNEDMDGIDTDIDLENDEYIFDPKKRQVLTIINGKRRLYRFKSKLAYYIEYLECMGKKKVYN